MVGDKEKGKTGKTVRRGGRGCLQQPVITGWLKQYRPELACVKSAHHFSRHLYVLKDESSLHKNYFQNCA